MILRCPCCRHWSLTPDGERNGFVCHVYGAFVPAEAIA